ncbi:upf0132 domain protein [Fusarium longipes]|uniref:Upf0132 domain protein n=1 Tax=Fusarium longipes TaxID=694270 RepID=A0A395S1G1_9HYPO|nr:upf0132 domain protein [Fusarium longipes]
MDFAPYQSSPPEHSRVTSPDYASPRPSYDARRSFSPVASPPPLQHPQPQRGWGGFDGQSVGWAAISPDNRAFRASSTMPGAFPAAEVSEFDTSLGMRLDYEACLAYVALPPLGAIILLILERNSDYVSWLFFLCDVALIAVLTLRAYKDAEILDRFEVPFFGALASRFLDDE